MNTGLPVLRPTRTLLFFVRDKQRMVTRLFQEGRVMMLLEKTGCIMQFAVQRESGC